jgi:hypothetical protein
MENDLSTEELEKILNSIPKEGPYCQECDLYINHENHCWPFEATLKDVERLTKEYRDKYNNSTECPYLK